MSSRRRAPTRLRFPGPFLTAAWTLTGRFPLQEPQEPTAYRSLATIIRLVFSDAQQTPPLFCPTVWEPSKETCLALSGGVIARGSLILRFGSRSTSWAGQPWVSPQSRSGHQKHLSETTVPSSARHATT